MNDHERGFLDFLLEPTKRRLETLLAAGEKRRRAVRELLDHAVRLDQRHCRQLTGSEASAAAIEAVLRKHGAPSTCHILAAHPELDGREMPLGAALAAAVGSDGGVFLSCIPGRLGYFEYEDAKSSFLLSR